MFEQVIPEKTKSHLALLGKDPLLGSFYLAGGTAIALHLGHRRSFDLDFFRAEPFNESVIAPTLQAIGNVSLESQNQWTFIGALNQIKISYFRYGYPLLRPTLPFAGIQVADLEDLVAMKLDAIGSRGKKRDFIDLFTILTQRIPLHKAIALLQKKYQGVDYSLPHILKSLIYFEDAEQDNMPEMIQSLEWDSVKQFFESEVPRYLKQLT